MRKILLPVKHYSRLTRSVVPRFHRVPILTRKRKGVQVDDGAILLCSAIIPGMELYYDPSELERKVGVRIYPLYLGKILFIGYVCMSKHPFSITKNGLNLQLPNARSFDFESSKMYGLHILTSVDKKSLILLSKEAKL